MTTKDNTLFRYHGRNWNDYNKPDFKPRFRRACEANDRACRDREEGIIIICDVKYQNKAFAPISFFIKNIRSHFIKIESSLVS